MNREEMKHEASRYLVQQSERGSLLWASPAGQESSNQTHVVDEVTQSTDISSPATETESSGDIMAQRWEHGAPEPEPVIPLNGVIEDAFPDWKDLDSFRQAICNCQKCPLGRTRNKLVFGTGDPNADLVLVGEAPGADEDMQGEPFVGRAGKLLDKILEAVQLHRGERVYIANILKCRPPGNREPLPKEVERCEPHLVKQLQLLEPKVIVALGRVAAQTLLRTTRSLTALREKVHDYHGVPLLVTYHPAALLRNPNWKRPTWEDVQKMKSMLDNRNIHDE